MIGATTGANTERYIHTLRGIHAMQNNAGTWSYAVQDGLGSVRSEIDEALNLVASGSYQPYGRPIHTPSAFGLPYQFTGEMRDFNGLQYHRARYYSPDLGVWMSLDPLETLNRYAYVNGNPVNFVDRSGLQFELLLDKGDLGGGGGGAEIIIIGAAVASAAASVSDELYDAADSVVDFVGDVATSAYNSTIGAIFGGGETVDQPADVPQDAGDIDWSWPRRLAELCNQNGWCRWAIWELLRRLLQGIDQLVDPIARSRPEEDPENDCLDGLTPLQAAHRYAQTAQDYWLQGTQVAGWNAPVTTAVTVVKTGSRCTEFVAVSNALGTPNPVRTARYRAAWIGIVAFASIRAAVPLGFPEPNQIEGIEGHAERLLYNRLGTNITAMGISKHPCQDDIGSSISCSRWFAEDPQNAIRVAYWNGVTTQTFQ